MDLSRVPEELKRSSRWVLWRLETVEGRERCKVPKTLSGSNASPTDPDSWCRLEDGLKKLPKPHPDYRDDPNPAGVGLVIGAPYLGLDLDKCLEEGKLHPWALELMGELPRTYAEVSPSGRGLHLWFRCANHGKLPDGVRTKQAEVYSRNRYFTVTGEWVTTSAPTVTELRDDQAKRLFELVEGLRETKKVDPSSTVKVDGKMDDLMGRIDFPDLSVAVQSLLTRLAIASTNDRKFIEENFKKSALYQQTHWREKWERLRERELDLACQHGHENVQRRLRGRPDPSTLTKRPRLINLEDVKAKELVWLWPGVIPEGNLALFAGMPGVGKSLLALDLVGRGSLGAQSVDRKAQLKPFKSLLLAAEDDRETILVPRLQAMGADLTKVRCLDMLEYVDDVGEVRDSRMVSLESDLDVVRQVLREDPAYRLLVIDPISNYMGSKSMYNDQEFRSITMPIVNLCQETGIAAIAVMHNSKQQGRSALEKVGASLGGVGTARIGWSFFRTEEAIEVLLMKRNLGNFPGFRFTTRGVPLEIEGKATEQARIEFLGESEASADNLLLTQEDAEERKSASVVKLLQKMIPRGGDCSAAKIVDAAQKHGIGPNALKKAKFELGIGSKKKKDGWYWRWMDESEMAPSPEDEAVPELF